MLIAKIYKFLFATETKIYTRRSLFWLGLGLIFSIVYSLLALHQAFDADYIVQDDARQHIFWMSRFIDPELFPNDLIANYYQSIAPWGCKSLYRFAAVIGVDPWIFNKFLPGILATIVTFYCFAVSLELLPIPFGAFVTTLLLNQNLWAERGLISGTAKDFVYPLFFIFIYYWLKRSLIGVCIAILLAALFYPPTVLIFAGALFLQFWQIKNFRISLNKNKQVYLLSSIGLAVAFVVLLPYVLASSEFGPTVTLEQAKNIPQFASGGRTSFFDDNFWDYWIIGRRSGIRLDRVLIPDLTYAVLLLPLLFRFSNWFPLSKKINPQISYLNNLLIASFGWFFLAHAVLFRLYLPSRYVSRTLRVLIVIAASTALMLLLETILHWASDRQYRQKISSIIVFTSAIALFSIALVGYPATRSRFINTGYIAGTYPQLYQFLAAQPKSALIASLSDEADSISSFTQRSVLVSKEHGIPYHMGYFKPLNQRIVNLIEAQYTSEIRIVQNFIARYGVTLWLIDKSSFNTEYLTDNRWLMDRQSVTQQAIANLQDKTPAIALLQDRCKVFEDDEHIVMNGKCISDAT